MVSIGALDPLPSLDIRAPLLQSWPPVAALLGALQRVMGWAHAPPNGERVALYQLMHK
jgi:hypothetical protein